MTEPAVRRDSSLKHVAAAMSTETDETGKRRSGYSLNAVNSVKDMKEKQIVNIDKLTSDYFGPSNPPKDWCDLSLLIPHEGLRVEMTAMAVSVAAMTPNSQPWQLVYFAEWYSEFFCPLIHGHHHAEEEIYFKAIQAKATLPPKLAKDHVGLVNTLQDLQKICQAIRAAKGKNCTAQVQQLQQKVPPFIQDMREHLKEEEMSISPILREHFTREEEDALIQQIVASEGLTGARKFFPAIFMAMDDWATEEFRSELIATIPKPVWHLMQHYYLPDYKTQVHPMRDAPLSKTKPTLTRVPCCGIPFCCPCIL